MRSLFALRVAVVLTLFPASWIIVTHHKLSVRYFTHQETSYFGNQQQNAYAFHASDTHAKNPEQVDNKSRALVHVGPHKTGTSVIQTYIFKSRINLQIDGYTVQPGGIPGRFYDHKAMNNVAFFLQNDQISDLKTWPYFLKWLRWSKDRNRGIVMSAEGFCRAETNIVELAYALEQAGYSPKHGVKIVVTYRRAYEWLYSLYSQIVTKWTKTFPSFAQWFDDLQIQSPSWRHSDQITRVVERYRQHFSNVHVINYHDDSNSLPAKFFCEALDNANRTCRYAKLTSYARVNVGHNREYRRLLLYAFEQGMLTNLTAVDLNKTVLNELEQKVRIFHEGPANNLTLKDLPLNCITEAHRDLLFDLTWDEERGMSPFITQHRREDEVRDAYRQWSSQPSSPLCAIDTEHVLKEEKWIRFFKGLSFDG